MIKLRSLLYESKTLLVYHGTHTVFNRFDMEKSAQGIIWFASDKNRILSGVSGANSTKVIITANITLSNPCGWDEYEKHGLWELKRLGYDGCILPDDNGFDCFVFSTKQIKIIGSEVVKR